MPLPIHSPKKIASLIIAQRKPDGTHEATHSEDSHPKALLDAAQALIGAVHSKDSEAVCRALSSAFEYLDGTDAATEQPDDAA